MDSIILNRVLDIRVINYFTYAELKYYSEKIKEDDVCEHSNIETIWLN